MTKKIITSYSAFLCMAVVMAGVSTAHASEVTGTLSSDTSNSAPTAGSISGTVTSGGGGNSSGGSRNNGSGGGSSSNSPSGSVLGVQDSNTQTPRFPNAGTLTEVSSTDQSLWSTVKAFFGKIFSF